MWGIGLGFHKLYWRLTTQFINLTLKYLLTYFKYKAKCRKKPNILFSKDLLPTQLWIFKCLCVLEDEVGRMVQNELRGGTSEQEAHGGVSIPSLLAGNVVIIQGCVGGWMGRCGYGRPWERKLARPWFSRRPVVNFPSPAYNSISLIIFFLFWEKN